MLGGKLRPFLKYSIITSIIGGTALSLRTNQYQLDSIGIVRLSRAACTVFQIGVIYQKNLYGTNLDSNSEEYRTIKSKCHKRSAEKLLDLCCINKGVYIKVGQHLAALEYLLPTEYVETMRVLHSHAPTNSIDDVYKVIREDLKKDPFDIFQSIEPQPLGAASLAQVHKATLKDGSTVAVKVQHPYVQGNSKVDMKTMEYLVKLMSIVFPEFKFKWLVDESKKNIPQELDFAQEGKNAEKIAKLFENIEWLIIPRIRWDLTTSRVLTMDFVEGGQVNDLKYIKENHIDPCEVSDKLGQLYSKMIFIHGFVHSDPHPGNILVKKSEKGQCDIVLLDHGLYANLKEEIRTEYANLWLSILNRDRKGMRVHSKNLGIEGNAYGLFACMVTGRSWDSIEKGIHKTSATILVDNGGDITALKRHGGWKSTSVAEGYLEDSVSSKKQTAQKILHWEEQPSMSSGIKSDLHPGKLSNENISNRINIDKHFTNRNMYTNDKIVNVEAESGGSGLNLNNCSIYKTAPSILQLIWVMLMQAITVFFMFVLINS